MTWLELIIDVYFFSLCGHIMYMMYKNTIGTTPKRTTPVKTVICIGSGGHTTEMLLLVEKLDPNLYRPRIYILADSDMTSYHKIVRTEEQFQSNENEFQLVKIPRSRKVMQSYFSSIFTTLYALLFSTFIMLKLRPNLVISNGPGTCIPICFLAFIMKIFLFCNIQSIFIESICRVESLSLTGKIQFYIADKIIVQSLKLKKLIPQAEFYGKLF